jgi:hypothetical protein
MGLLVFVGILASGCGVPEPPMACFDGDFPHWDWDAARHDGHDPFEYCEAFNMVCNEAVTLADECPGFISGLIEFIEKEVYPVLSHFLGFLPWLDVDEMMSWILDSLQGACGYVDILDRVGTCQPPGEEGDPCAEDADCMEPLVCLDQVCGLAPAAP